MIDTHCHLTYDGLFERIDHVVADALAAGVDRMISVGTTPQDAARAVQLVQRFPRQVLATAGVHPHYSDRVSDLPLLKRELSELLSQQGVVALGEMGLDRHYPEPSIRTQQAVFELQLELASEQPFQSLPIVIHNREATDLTLATLERSGLDSRRFVFHCFTGSEAEIEAILAFGAHVSFTGIITFSGAANVAKASDLVPLDRLMVETDSPYLTPAPHRKVRTNEPKYVPHVAAFLAARRQMTPEAFEEAVDANAVRFFQLPSTD